MANSVRESCRLTGFIRNQELQWYQSENAECKTGLLIIEAAVRHHIFDVLDKSPLTAVQVAKKTRASQRGVNAILDALVGFQLLQRKGNRFALTPESAAFLVSTKPGYHGALFNQMSGAIIPSWLQLNEVVRTGRPDNASKVRGVTNF